ncbi:hypothetical protein RUM43_003858 [Polyplax serrata]|uniref:Laminin G domain-containing protein n=1 Tax=Polyplax serrata TaxID=468196 RepID=A0AAN8P798_POLSC
MLLNTGSSISEGSLDVKSYSCDKSTRMDVCGTGKPDARGYVGKAKCTKAPTVCLLSLSLLGIKYYTALWDVIASSRLSIRSPRFTGQGWLAFPALQAAYKHVQLEMEFRPESWDGILFLTGERDDMTGDFMSLLLHQGYLEFRFDCGSGIGVVRSEETVNLNEWNRLVLYRHRWDAWIQLNNGKHVQGRSKGLFSRITFREPVFIGGPGNTTGLSEKLPLEVGLQGCIRHLDINDHTYSFELFPNGEAIKGFDVEENFSLRFGNFGNLWTSSNLLMRSSKKNVTVCQILTKIETKIEFPERKGYSQVYLLKVNYQNGGRL